MVAEFSSRTHFEWQLIRHAAVASDTAYEEMPDIDDGQSLRAKGQCKAVIVYIEAVECRRILVVAVRGTVTKDDWMLNINSSPKKSSKVSPVTPN